MARKGNRQGGMVMAKKSKAKARKRATKDLAARSGKAVKGGAKEPVTYYTIKLTDATISR